MFQEELKQSRMKVIMGKMKFWGKKTQTAAEEIAANETVRELGTAAKEATIEGIKSEPMKHVIAGGIAGGLIGTIIPIPFVGTAVGATVGATLGFYNWFTKS